MVFLLEISKNSTAGSLIIKAFCIHTHKPPRPAPLKHKASITAHRTSRCLRPFGHLYGFVLDLRRPPRLFSHIILFSTKVVFKKAQNTSVHPQILRKRQIFLAQWGRRLSWQEVADVFETSWNKVFSSVKMVVEYGLKHRNLEGIRAIGVDEWQWRKGHNYVTLVYQIEENCKRLLFISERRTVKSLLKFFRMIGNEASGQIQYICSDMWKPYLKVIKKKAPQALHILDRFHIISNLNKAINEIRAGEARKMKQEGYEEVLTHTKYCFLKNPENLTDNQKTKLGDVLQYDLKSVRAYLLKEAFQLFWSYKSPYWAGWYLEKWCNRAMRSKLEPIKKFAKSMRKHRPLIMNYFKAKKQFSSGVVEGLNRKINLTTRKAFGFRTFEGLQIALFHTMGNLPEPKTTHRFF